MEIRVLYNQTFKDQKDNDLKIQLQNISLLCICLQTYPSLKYVLQYLYKISHSIDPRDLSIIMITKGYSRIAGEEQVLPPG